MAIKKAKNGQMLEYLTIKIPGGFSAQVLAALALLRVQYDDKEKAFKQNHGLPINYKPCQRYYC